MVAVLPSEYCSTTVVLLPADEVMAISGAACAVDTVNKAPAKIVGIAVLNTLFLTRLCWVNAFLFIVSNAGISMCMVIIDSFKITVNKAANVVAESKA